MEKDSKQIIQIKQRFSQLRDEYLMECKRSGFSVLSIRSYKNALEYFFRWLRRNYPTVESISEINRQMISDYQMFLYSKTSRFGKRLSSATQYCWMGIVLWFFRWLLSSEKILNNPGALIHLPRRPERIPRNYLSLKEMQRLLNAPDTQTHIGLRNRTMLEVFYSTGLRAGELQHLVVDDVNLHDGWLTIRLGKGAKDRVVPIGRIAVHFVHCYLQNTRAELARDEKQRTLFVNQYGQRLSHQSINKIVQQNAKAAGIKRVITPHALRHTCATLMLRGRADIRHIQELLGHSSLSSTQIYTRVEISDLKKVHQRCHPRERKAPK